MLKKLFVKSAIVAAMGLGFSGFAAAETVVSVGAPAAATYGLGDTITFVVNYSVDGVVVAGGSPTLDFALSPGGARTATYTATGSTVNALNFTYTVQVGDNDLDGIDAPTGSITLGGGVTIVDVTGAANSTLTLNGVAATAGVNVDGVVPVVTSVDVPANATYTSGQDLDFVVNFGESVDVAGGTPNLGLSLNTGGAVNATYLSGTGSNALTFRYTVASGNEDLDGVLVGTLSLNGATIQDAAANDATLTLSNVGATTAVLVDALAPIVAEVTPVATPGTDDTPDLAFSSTEAGALSFAGGCGSATSMAVATISQTVTLSTLATGVYGSCTLTVTDAAGNASNVLPLTSFTINSAAVATPSQPVPVNSPYLLLLMLAGLGFVARSTLLKRKA